MFTLASPWVVRIFLVLIVAVTAVAVAWGSFVAGRSIGTQDERARHTAASLAAEISLGKRQRVVLNAASKQNQLLTRDFTQQISEFSTRLGQVRNEVRDLPRIEELNCAPGLDRVRIINRILSE